MYAKKKLVDLWNSYKRSRTFLAKSPKTQKCYAEMMVTPLRYFRGYTVTLGDGHKQLTGAVVDRYINYRLSCDNGQGGRIAPSTVKKELVVCSNAVKHAQRKEYVNIPNPFLESSGGFEVRTEPRDVVLPQAKDWELLLALPRPARDIVEFALTTGFRKGEILGLTMERISRKQVVVNGETVTKHLVEFAPEDQKSRRRGVRALSKRAVEIVEAQNRESGHVFQHHGSKVRETWLRYRFDRAAERIGMPELHFHDLRHTFFTRQAEKGIPLHWLSEQAGHSTIRTLERVYKHSTGELAWKAVN